MNNAVISGTPNGRLKAVWPGHPALYAEVIEDSRAPNGKRLLTMVLSYQRFVHAEFMTHRMFSRNAASSRAIPVEKVRARVRAQPAMPVFWGKNKAGMQAEEELTGARLWLVKALWRGTGILVSGVCALLDLLGLHKQITNRMVEPWFNIVVVATGTDDAWGNFFNLRYHKAAQPEIAALTECAYEVFRLHEPKLVAEGKYHLPFVTAEERLTLPLETQIQCAVARCARTTYMNHDGSNPSPEKDRDLYQKLVGQLHVSPFEHVATPAPTVWFRSGNFFGWFQHRQNIPNEYRPHFPGPTT
jgi:hypothetical protein